MARIHRARETTHFTVLANQVLRDPRLSYRATGILARLLSEPPDSVINSAALATERPGKEGRDALLAALRELERAGYLTRPRWQDGRGRWHTDWIVSSVPVLPEEHMTRLSRLAQPPPPATRPPPVGWPDADEDKDVNCG
jgi:hypothetical protein